jgi:hypothetical protein
MPKAIQAEQEAVPAVEVIKIKERSDRTITFTLPAAMLPAHRSRIFLIAGDNLDDLVSKKLYPDLNKVLSSLRPGTHKIDNLRVLRGSKSTTFEMTLQGNIVPKELREKIEKVCKKYARQTQYVRE